MTAVTIQLTAENVAFLNRQVKSGWYKDQNVLFNELLNSAREIERMNKRMEKHIQSFLDRGENPPVPYANSVEDEIRLLDEAVASGESAVLDDQEWADIRAEFHARYKANKRKQ